MPDIALDLRYLKYAIAASQHNSFRRAADVLNVAQSTISRRIAILERRVGITLFDRHRSGARITTAGRKFLSEAAVGAMHLQQAVTAATQVDRGCTGIIRIGLIAPLANGFLTDLLTAYHRRFPSVELIFHEASSEVTASALLDGRLDVAFMPDGEFVRNCRAERLWGEKIHVAVPASHPAASSQTVHWEDVRGETFLVVADAAGPEIEDYLNRCLSQPGFRPHVSVQHIGSGNLLSMVAQGFGVALTTDTMAGISYPGVRFVPVDGAEVSFHAVWSSVSPNPALKLLIEAGLEQRARTSASY
ncbi:LysR family transcriptional regulator [Sphingobium sp.]|uniref:LysR family transcriptional regulator n=1 Tax=Sphingobium sp. TaxID=1912891 RepID=UPI000DB0FB22|nr:LysR family transcriptional regulator [Sphingobium sp.]PZU69315.1 MAG: LysR family transcriptional regulator [Sphingobium sp.]